MLQLGWIRVYWGSMVRLTRAYGSLESQGQIWERMNIQNFLNPIAEAVDDHEEDVLESIIARHQGERVAKSDEDVVEEVPVVLMSEALSALKILQTYEEQQGSGDPSLTKALRRRERELQLQKTGDLCQHTLKDCLGAK